MYMNPSIDGIKQFEIFVHRNEFKPKAKKPYTRLKQMMYCIGHELVHVKQFVNGELFEYADEVRCALPWRSLQG